jgi:hypothetical protein
MFLGQHSNRLPEFIQQGRGIDACGSDALTSVAGGYQGGSSMPACASRPSGEPSIVLDSRHASTLLPGEGLL